MYIFFYTEIDQVTDFTTFNESTQINFVLLNKMLDDYIWFKMISMWIFLALLTVVEVNAYSIEGL